ncbi:MAG: carboxypeptidase-like regulatory domain-containing protein [Bryobacteraceae bacterium]|nr:carboxypeptidase-like regulatory domain-containing protein [Bryobacteraceae bacterium]MDW8378199.1 carboxypeptidase-like regulatory domain-containing protein [Bryobacterales bacterium]
MLLAKICLASCVFTFLLFGQAGTADITGTVTDSSGAVVSGATVTITNPATGFSRILRTNEQGIYTAPALIPGAYTVKVEMQGFQTQTRSNVVLQVGQVAAVDFTLAVGNVAEVIEVTGGVPVLETETTSVGTVIENKRIVELPLNGRNYLQLASLIPGATTNGPASSQGQQRMGGARNSFALNVAGQRVHFNHYALDGIENTDPNFNTYLFLPSIDALQEFKVESGLFSAEYGRAIAQVNVTTKSGSNQFHGVAFAFVRNSFFDARDFFARPTDPTPPFKRNQFGGTFSGPVLVPKLYNGKNRLFFMFNYEGLRERRSLTRISTLPDARFRSGNFGFLNRPIRDPDNPGQVFPNAIIPESRIHPISRRVLNEFYPLPNQAGSGPLGITNNYLNNESRRTDGNQFTVRNDFSASQNHNFFFRFSQTKEPQYIPSVIFDQGNNVDVLGQQGVLGHTAVFGPSKVNEFKFGMNYFNSANIQQRAFRRNVVAELGLEGISQDPLFWGIPVFQISGFANVGECNDCPFVNWNTTFQFTDNFSWTVGKHSFKFGGEFRRLRYNQIGAVVPRGRFTWNGQYTGEPMADMLLGLMSSTEGQVGAPIANFRQNYMALYIQDTWKITRKLTMNWGLRWEYESPFMDKHDAIVNVDFAWDNSREPVFVRAGKGDVYQGNPQFPAPPGWQLVRDGRFGRGAGVPDRNDFGPRVGLAYQLTQKTVLRSGFGIYYVRDIANAVFDIVRNIPFTIRQAETADTTRPNLFWNRLFTSVGSPSFLLINQYGERTSYVNQWQASIQRQLTKDMSLEITYMGSTGVKLRRLTSYNNPEPRPGNPNLNRPFPKFNGSFQNMNAPSNSIYHALQMRLQHRFANGFTLLGSYAYGKSIDNGSGIRTTDGDPLTPSDNYNLRGERGLSAFDFRQRFTASFLYELPFGRGRKIGIENRALNFLFGGWQLGGIVTFQDGFPATVFCGPGNIQNGGGYCKPDAVPGVKANLPDKEKSLNRFFNTEAYVDRLGVPPGAPQPVFRYGTAGRNTVIGPGIASVDASINKFFRFHSDQHTLELRGEFFNAPNRPNFGQPGVTLRTPTYGVISSTRVDNRQIQVAMKYSF